MYFSTCIRLPHMSHFHCGLCACVCNLLIFYNLKLGTGSGGPSSGTGGHDKHADRQEDWDLPDTKNRPHKYFIQDNGIPYWCCQSGELWATDFRLDSVLVRTFYWKLSTVKISVQISSSHGIGISFNTNSRWLIAVGLNGGRRAKKPMMRIKKAQTVVCKVLWYIIIGSKMSFFREEV